MITTIFKQHKKICFTILAIISFLLIGLYLSVLYEPGFWYMDTFLTKQTDGTFAGSDAYDSYRLKVDRTDNSATVTFSVNELTKEYLITDITTEDAVYIYENDTLVFHGQKIRMSDSEYMLLGYDGYEDGNIRIFASGIPRNPEDLLPSYSWLYNRAAYTETETRGEPGMLFLILLLIIILTLDIVFPDLFFILSYQPFVNGGEPSDWYRSRQKVGRLFMIIGILICIVRSLYPF